MHDLGPAVLRNNKLKKLYFYLLHIMTVAFAVFFSGMLFDQHYNMILFIQCSLFNCFIFQRYDCGYYSLDLVWFLWTFNLVLQLCYNDVFLQDVWIFSKPPLASKRFLKVFIGVRITQMFHQMKKMLKAWRESYKSAFSLRDTYPLSIFVLQVKSHCILLTAFFLLNSKRVRAHRERTAWHKEPENQVTVGR